MVEKAFTLWNREKRGLVALIFINEFDIGFIESKVVLYCDQEHVALLSSALDTFPPKVVSIRDMIEKLRQDDVRALYDILRCFDVVSENKNKSSRISRILKAENVEHFVKVVKYVGIT